jgi:hypothetical protein
MAKKKSAAEPPSQELPVEQVAPVLPPFDSPEYDAPPVKRIPAGKFLHESGLLFEINRTLLHPLGLALEVVVDGDSVTLGDLWDYRHDIEGMLYAPTAFAHGRAKHLGMMAAWGYDAHQKRKAALGFVVQEK